MIWSGHHSGLIPLGAALRSRMEQLRVGFFLHVRFPPAPLFATLPQAERLLRFFGAYQLVGTQTEPDAEYLRQALMSCDISARVDAFPVGIDAEGFADTAVRSAHGPEVERLRVSLSQRALILGVDRLDYTKGLPERFRGYAQLLRRFPAIAIT